MKNILAGVFALSIAATSHAKPTAADIKAAMPDLPPALSIQETPMKGIYEVSTANSVFFVDDALKYLIGGEMYDVKTQKSVTKPTIDKVRASMAAQQIVRQRTILGSIDKKDAIVEKKGDGKSVMYVFTDPFCTFCARLEKELEKVNNVTIYRFLTPFKGPAAEAQASTIWCSNDKLAAWNAAMAGKPLKAAKCDAPITKTMALAQPLGITGTPTLFKPDGSRLNGAQTKEVLEAWLAE